jgi:serine/threonine protein kinase
MSPELLDPESFGLKRSHPTKESDRYALGMVVYEVLNGRAPFAPSKAPVLKILRGERPERPLGAQGAWFTDGIWMVLERCWKPHPEDRPSLDTVFRCLQNVTQPLRPPSHVDASVGTDTEFSRISPQRAIPVCFLCFVQGPWLSFDHPRGAKGSPITSHSAILKSSALP